MDRWSGSPLTPINTSPTRMPAESAGEPSATLLDRTGKPLAVPLQVAARDEGGVRWITVETAIAPLAPGDYGVEVKLGEAARTTAFRVVP